ncbi:MAG: flagellar hook-basal body complex protein FliE [Ignavibacteria bacterium]|nr:flagellar hook-basal body complex protein FliE [Ignavibacteria bacterium]
MPIRVDELNLQRQLQQELISNQKKLAVEGDSFIETLKQMINEVNELQKESVKLTEGFIKGEPIELHDVMIAAEKAKTSFQLLMEIRNKFLDFYREIIRMQV